MKNKYLKLYRDTIVSEMMDKCDNGVIECEGLYLRTTSCRIFWNGNKSERETWKADLIVVIECNDVMAQRGTIHTKGGVVICLSEY